METQEFDIDEIDEKLKQNWFLYGPVVVSPEGVMKQYMIRRLKGHGIYKTMEEIARNKPSNFAGVQKMFARILELMGRVVNKQLDEEQQQTESSDLYDEGEEYGVYNENEDEYEAAEANAEANAETEAMVEPNTAKGEDTIEPNTAKGEGTMEPNTVKGEAMVEPNTAKSEGTMEPNTEASLQGDLEAKGDHTAQSMVAKKGAATELRLTKSIDRMVVESIYGSPFEFIRPSDMSKWNGLLNWRRVLLFIFRPLIYIITFLAKLGARGSYSLVAKMVYAFRLFMSIVQFNEKQHWDEMDVMKNRIDTMATINGFSVNDLRKEDKVQVENLFAPTAESRQRLDMILQQQASVSP